MVYMVYDYGLSLVSLSVVAVAAVHILLETVLATLNGCPVNADLRSIAYVGWANPASCGLRKDK